ncbi:hypothetical protein SeMB42_g06063 [Synchytrium endobioticum]|uniref:Ubiquitin carboxyl-terminal hydrolase n=1 Tax=Synchytrium endobioticum TaxID=286115 RepID=A0A507CS62_9FUNG|nr:hypothetical protein SeMB42_g06063 [Synchytrium endobioticum]TPX41997.1 hypothetical protein SeLEV6574_g05817 [Synchytrium endobioticum]
METLPMCKKITPIVFGDFTLEELNAIVDPDTLLDRFTPGWTSGKRQKIQRHGIKPPQPLLNGSLSRGPISLGSIVTAVTVPCTSATANHQKPPLSPPNQNSISAVDTKSPRPLPSTCNGVAKQPASSLPTPCTTPPITLQSTAIAPSVPSLTPKPSARTPSLPNGPSSQPTSSSNCAPQTKSSTLPQKQLLSYSSIASAAIVNACPRPNGVAQSIPRTRTTAHTPTRPPLGADQALPRHQPKPISPQLTITTQSQSTQQQKPLSPLTPSPKSSQSKPPIPSIVSTSPVPTSATSETPSIPSPSSYISNSQRSIHEPPKQGPKSWADLVKTRGPSNSKSGITGYVAKPEQARTPSFHNRPSDLLKHFEPSMDASRVVPRGLVNNGNMCFMNAILQPLVYCPPFLNLMKMVAKKISHSFNKRMVLTEAVIMFMNEFKMEDDPKTSPDSAPAAPFAPEYVYDALRTLKKINSIKGRQEDAEEFLGFLLDGLHEELLGVIQEADSSSRKGSVIGTSNGSSESDGTWVEIGKGNKTLVTRRMEMAESPITKIFSGRMRSAIKAPGCRDSVTDEPFVFLHLDINPDAVRTIDDALRNVAVPEVLDEFTSSTKGIKVEATKQNLLATFPPILMVHLKRFVYSQTGGTQKIHKHVGYSTELDVCPELISPTTRRTVSAVKYKLFAVVYHHGKLAAGGHYTCDVLRAPNQWLSVDDAAIQKVHVSDVLREKRDRDVYMLMYFKV